MPELALHILDLLQNSVVAGATMILVTIAIDQEKDSLIIIIEDNGRGMTRERAEAVVNPFVTSRTTRRVGLGIPMFKAAAEMTGGAFALASEEGKGTRVEASFGLSHIDRMPLGDMTGTMIAMVLTSPDVDFDLCVTVNGEEFELDTPSVREALGGNIALSEPDVIAWLTEALQEGMTEVGATAF